MKRTKAWRRWKDHSIQMKRLKEGKVLLGETNRRIVEPHRLDKSHPMDCGCSKCYMCHGEKLLDEVNPHDVKRSKVVIKSEYELDGNEDIENDRYILVIPD